MQTKPTCVGFSPTSCGSAIIPPKAGGAERNGRSGFSQEQLVFQAWHRLPRSPHHSWRGSSLPQTAVFCLLSQGGRWNFCVYGASYSNKSKTQAQSNQSPGTSEGSQHFLAFADPLGRSEVSDESFCSQRLFSSLVLQGLSLSDASRQSGPSHCRSSMHCLDFFSSLMWWKLLREILRNILVHLYLWASYSCFRIKLRNIVPEGISWAFSPLLQANIWYNPFTGRLKSYFEKHSNSNVLPELGNSDG